MRPLRFRLVAVFLTLFCLTPYSHGEFVLSEATIADIQGAYLSGDLTSTELVNRYLARIKAYHGAGVAEPKGRLGRIETIPHPGKINSIATLNLRPATLKEWGFDPSMARTLTDPADNDPQKPDALATAATLDAYFATTGQFKGPLHGVVFAIKDQFDTFDLHTTSAATVPYADDHPPLDAVFVQRLRDAGAIILAKSTMGEYASGIPRSSFNGTLNNPYDTERSPIGSSSGSGSAVAANLVTVAIGKETGTSIRGPSTYNSAVRISPTQELVPRHGMFGFGINTRTDPIARTVADAARVLEVIAGYSPADFMSAGGASRAPNSYANYANNRRLDGVRIGVLREYMHQELFPEEDHQAIDLIEKAIIDLRALGAIIVDPGPDGDLLTPYVRQNFHLLYTPKVAENFPELFPVDEEGNPTTDRVATLVALTLDSSKVPDSVTIRSLRHQRTQGASCFTQDLGLALRGDATIKTTTDLIETGTFFDDERFGNRKRSLKRNNKDPDLDTRDRLHRRYASRHIVLHAMADLQLDAILSPTNNIPPPKLGSPSVPRKNGRPLVWSFLGAQGFPTLTVPAGYTTAAYDRVLDPDSPPVPSTGYWA
ncbi:MAG: amidase [Candidatus Synoicihabitans palmerolidicus]|nr:amidase [Candidatus Synoicihabitans palmerolidicus]